MSPNPLYMEDVERISLDFADKLVRELNNTGCDFNDECEKDIYDHIYSLLEELSDGHWRHYN